MNANHSQPPDPAAWSPEIDDPRVPEALEQYLAAIEAGAEPNRQAFLARHADIAQALAECLDGMEALHGAASSASLSGAAGPNGPAADWHPGMPLGDFRIVREIGRGGMGVVYQAEQLSLGRRIALKVLPFALTLDPRQLQRFKNEARAAAHLHHQNIVPVYAVGCERGVHFYAMQFIEGQSLAEVIQQLQRTASPSRSRRSGARGRLRQHPGPNSPSADAGGHEEAADTAVEPVGALATAYSTDSPHFFRTVAQLGAQAAEALEHAHQYGVVHRDIKPGNLLVDGQGKLWVTDFGLAQFHSDGGLTQTGDLLGTIRYMSPEQAGGQHVLLDHRTDVYSLGATLAELLTLRPLFDGVDRQTLLHQILYDEPRPPAAVDPSIPAELETILLKAVAKAPAERYATARALADDLHRFLRHEPILARRATPLQRARKWLRRHPSMLAAGVVLLHLLAAGSLVSAWLIRGEQAKTRLAYERERQHAEEAEEQFRLARASVNEMIQLAEEEMSDKPYLQGLRRRLLEAALVYYQKFIEQRRDDPDTRAELAATRDRVKKILDDLAVLQGAGQLTLLAEPAVLDDLRLGPEQRERIGELAHRLGEQRMDSFREFHRLSTAERRQRFLDLARANEAAVTAVLTARQLERLRQIALQVQGPLAFQDLGVTTALKLTPEQKDRLGAIEADAFLREPGGPPGGPPRGPGNPRKGREQILALALEKMCAVLTVEQARRWKELTGEPFTGPMLRCQPAPPDSCGPPH